MEKLSLRFIKLACATVAGVAVFQVYNLQAGWTGLINGAGVGWSSVNVRSVTMETNRATTPSIANPSASISPGRGYVYGTNLPSGASLATYSRIKGFAGGIWQAMTYAVTGDGADNLELESRLNINPSPCASLVLDSIINQAAFNSNGHSSTIEVTTVGTAGTALWLRGFEYTGDQSLLPPDDPNTVPNETIEYLKIHGTWKFETLILGPFEFGTNGTCPLLIPFTLTSTNLENLIFAADGVAKSVPFTVTCPSDVSFKCGEAVKFPAAEVSGGCGQITGTWSPEENYAFPVGVTPVTVTVTDGASNTTSCTFNVIITDTEKPATPTLPTLNYNLCSGTPVMPPAPTTTDACAGTVTGTTTNVFPITQPGTNVVTWTFDDGNGNVTTANQTIILTGFTFAGFYSPISGTGGACSLPLRNIKQGSNIPLKFDMLCGTSYVTTGQPPVVKIQLWSECAFVSEPVSVNAVYQNDWHYNWDTTGWAKGVYKVIVVLPDGSSQHVFIRLR